MGHVLAQMIEEKDGFALAGMVDPLKGESLADLEDVDVVIDFSNPANLPMVMAYCEENKCPAVIATTGFSDEDAEKIKEALRTLFENDASSARPDGSMEVVRVYWWKHNCPMGQYSSAKVHRLLKIEKKTEFPKNIDDYEITLDSLPGLEVEIIEGI